jgi:hypothetical protein
MSYKQCDYKIHLKTNKHAYFVEHRNEIPENLTGEQLQELYFDISKFEFARIWQRNGNDLENIER